MKKIVSFEELDDVFAKKSVAKKVLIGGCFDLFHYGHLTFLKNSKSEGNFLIVALESDEFIKNRKKRDPIHNQGQRAEILASIAYVNLVIKLPFLKSDSDYSELVERIKPTVIAVTKGDKQIENKKKQALKVGAELKVVTDLMEDFSSQKIIRSFE